MQCISITMHIVFALFFCLLWSGTDWFQIILYGPFADNDMQQKSINWWYHYIDVIMIATASQITGLMVVYSTFYSGANQIKLQSSASLAHVQGIGRWPVNSEHKRPVTRKMFPFDDVIMIYSYHCNYSLVWRIVCSRGNRNLEYICVYMFAILYCIFWGRIFYVVYSLLICVY